MKEILLEIAAWLMGIPLAANIAPFAIVVFLVLLICMTAVWVKCRICND